MREDQPTIEEYETTGKIQDSEKGTALSFIQEQPEMVPEPASECQTEESNLAVALVSSYLSKD